MMNTKTFRSSTAALSVGGILALLTASGCGGSDSTDFASTDGGSGAGGMTGAGATGAGGGSSSPTGLKISLSATTAPYPHQDGLSGMTARQIRAGVSRLELVTQDGQAWRVFDRGTESTEVSYDEGARTELVDLVPAELVPGHYVEARMVQDWSSFELDAVLNQGAAQPGVLSGLVVMSEGVQIQGQTHGSGHYEYLFNRTAGGSLTFSGEDFPVPEQATTAEAEARLVDGRWTVVFPVDLKIEATTAGTLDVLVNMHEAFRWQDAPGFTQGGYDFAPPFYEVVEQFGGNRFEARVVP